ncbi:hypothetical protein BCSAG_29160 [Bacillus cereus]
MRWQYSHLNETPYLYPSKELRIKYKGSSGKKKQMQLWITWKDMRFSIIVSIKVITVYQTI